MYIESLLAVAIYYCIGHGWMALIGNSARRALRLYREAIERVQGPGARVSPHARAGAVAFWAFVGPLFWPIDVINSARQGQLPKL